MVENSQKSFILVIFDIFSLPRAAQTVPEGRDPPKKAGSKNFYKKHQIKSPEVYFIDLYRFTKSITSPDLKFMGSKKVVFYHDFIAALSYYF